MGNRPSGFAPVQPGPGFLCGGIGNAVIPREELQTWARGVKGIVAWTMSQSWDFGGESPWGSRAWCEPCD
jgi:hypothetical protein